MKIPVNPLGSLSLSLTLFLTHTHTHTLTVSLKTVLDVLAYDAGPSDPCVGNVMSGLWVMNQHQETVEPLKVTAIGLYPKPMGNIDTS